MVYQVLLVAYLIVALLLIGFVLIQQGKGAGGSNTVFGSSGSGNFMTRATGFLATAFFVISLLLGNITARQEKAPDEWENLEVPATQQAAPADTDVPAVPVEDNTGNTPD